MAEAQVTDGAPMEIGLAIPPCPSAAGLADTLRYADGAGFGAIWVPDRTVAGVPVLDALTMLGAVALVTSRVRIGTLSYVTARRNPVLSAKALATADHLSGGRLTVGVGVGGLEPAEFAVAGVDPSQRGRLTDEHLDLWARIWTEDEVVAEGDGYACRGLTFRPRPARPIPIWIAGGSRAAQERAGRRGDGWLPSRVTPETFAAGWDLVADTATAAGRDPTSIVPGAYLFGAIDPGPGAAEAALDAALQGMVGRPLAAVADSCLFGTPDQWIERIEPWERAGVRHLSVLLFTSDLDRDVRLVGDEVLPAFAARGAGRP